MREKRLKAIKQIAFEIGRAKMKIPRHIVLFPKVNISYVHVDNIFSSVVFSNKKSAVL